MLTREEMVAEFDLDRVTHSAAFFDYKKLDWLNGEYLRALSHDELTDRVYAIAHDRWGDRVTRELAREVAELGQERAVTVVALVDQADFLFMADADFGVGED